MKNKFLISLAIQLRRIFYLFFGKLNSLFGYKPYVFILCYHSISNDSWRYSITSKNFERQISYLLEHFVPLTVTDLKLILNGEKKINKTSFLITFDDGYADILKVRDFIKRSGIKPVAFVLGDPKKANYKELGTKKRFLNKKEIEQLQKDKWTIGSHSMTHTDFNKLQTIQELNYEIVMSKNKYSYFAYPKGRYNSRVLDTVRSANYSLGFSMDDGFINTKTIHHVLPRIGVDKTHSFIEFKHIFLPLPIIARRFVKNRLISRYL